MRCFRPQYKVNPKKNPLPGDPRWIKYPCGKCLACQKNKRDEWSYRLQVELDNSGPSFFVTLTYSDLNIPVGDHGFQVLKSDVKKFTSKLYKKTRERFDAYKRDGVTYSPSADRHFRYFICSEYGPESKRPHYHGLIFFPIGCDITLHEFTCEVRRCWSCVPEPVKYLPNGAPFTIPLGNVMVDLCNGNRIGYTSKYVVKSLLPDDFRDTWSVKSLKPPIGSQFLSDPEMVNYITERHPLFVNGYPVSTPRYYRSKVKKHRFTQSDFDAMERDSYTQDIDQMYNAFDRWRIINNSSDFDLFYKEYRHSAEESMEANLISKLKNKSQL